MRQAGLVEALRLRWAERELLKKPARPAGGVAPAAAGGATPTGWLGWQRGSLLHVLHCIAPCCTVVY